MARTKRYDAIRNYLAERDATIAKKQQVAEEQQQQQQELKLGGGGGGGEEPAPPVSSSDVVKQGTERWIRNVVGGPLKLCPFAASSSKLSSSTPAMTVLVCKFSLTNNNNNNNNNNEDVVPVGDPQQQQQQQQEEEATNGTSSTRSTTTTTTTTAANTDTSEMTTTTLKDYAWFVYKAARQLVQEENQEDDDDDDNDDTKVFRSTIIVFPHYHDEVGALYEEIITTHKHYIGSVNDIEPIKENRRSNSNSLQRINQMVQAIPFEGYEVNEMKYTENLPTRPITAMAPWTSIQLIRYSDFMKLSKQLRRRILKRNDTTMEQLSETKKLTLLRNCMKVEDEKDEEEPNNKNNNNKKKTTTTITTVTSRNNNNDIDCPAKRTRSHHQDRLTPPLVVSKRQATINEIVPYY